MMSSSRDRVLLIILCWDLMVIDETGLAGIINLAVAIFLAGVTVLTALVGSMTLTEMITGLAGITALVIFF